MKGDPSAGSIHPSAGSGSGGERLLAFVGFAGFGLVDIVLREFGFEVVGVEIDDAIAGVNRRNGGHCLTADLLDCAPADYAGWFLYHFSPPCISFSVAKQGGETEIDLALACKICEFIRVGRPAYFTLENVWGYRKSLSWLLIWYTLLEEGYGVAGWNLNAADYGVPQSRRRMIVIARRDGRPPAKPWPTHAKKPDMFTLPWLGWYEAIEDLIPDLPESEFAPWQMDRMPEELKTYLIMTANTNRGGLDNKTGRGVLDIGEPANTVTAGPAGGTMPKAFLVGHSSVNMQLIEPDDPAYTITAHSQRARAFLMGQGERSRPKSGGQPADTVTANHNRTGIRAFVFDSANSNSNEGQGTIKDASDPIFAITAMEKTAFPKAFIVDCQNNGSLNRRGLRGLTIRQQDDPVFTMTASANRQTIRACLISGRVISMTPRALARFQDFPDWFVLPENRTLSCRGIGNALPPGVYRAVLKSLLKTPFGKLRERGRVYAG